MVKAVVGEETQLNSAEDRLSQSGLPSEVGLVIGKISSALDRGFVLDLVPTPCNDAGDPASSLVEAARDGKKKGSKGKSQVAESLSLSIDQDWVAEHARQVSRMLVGGIKVIGIYIWASESCFKNSTMLLRQTAIGVASAARLSDPDLKDRLIIHISYSPRRWTCRSCSLSSHISSSSLQPCDFKLGRVIAFFQTFRCIYKFDLRLPIFHEGASHGKTLSDALHYGISIHAKSLSEAKATIDGNLMIEDEPCNSDGLHEVELLLPVTSNILVEACNQKEVAGILVLAGSLCSYAHLNSKELISQALSDIKDDIITSLHTRLDILCDEADGDTFPISDEMSTEIPICQFVLHGLRNQCSLSFPRRVFVPWLTGIFICDYLQPSETLEVLKDRCVELLSMQAPADVSKILQPETEVPTLDVKSFWDVAGPFCNQPDPNSASTKTEEKNVNKEKSEKGGSNMLDKMAESNLMLAVLMLLLAMLVGWLVVKI